MERIIKYVRLISDFHEQKKMEYGLARLTHDVSYEKVPSGALALKFGIGNVAVRATQTAMPVGKLLLRRLLLWRAQSRLCMTNVTMVTE